MDDWEERLIDWLLDKAAWWIKVVITALCISWFACGVSIAAFGALALLTSNKGVDFSACGFLLGGLGSAAFVLIFLFRTWAGYWPFYTIWKEKRKIRAKNFLPVAKRENSAQV